MATNPSGTDGTVTSGGAPITTLRLGIGSVVEVLGVTAAGAGLGEAEVPDAVVGPVDAVVGATPVSVDPEGGSAGAGAVLAVVSIMGIRCTTAGLRAFGRAGVVAEGGETPAAVLVSGFVTDFVLWVVMAGTISRKTKDTSRSSPPNAPDRFYRPVFDKSRCRIDIYR